MTLDTIEGGEVTIVSEPTASHMERIANIAKTNPNSFIAPLSVLIVDWNLEGEDGQKLAITEENIGKIDFRDVSKVAELVKSAFDLEKKV